MKETKLSGYHLKMIALITMLVDHIAAVLIWRVYKESFVITGSMQLSDFIGDKIIVWVAGHQELVYTIYENMRLIGRMAFPIYCFLLVEGFLHTSNVKKYGVRLLLFAFLSEIPFDLALTGHLWDTSYSNVFFTLVIALVAMWAFSYVEKLAEFLVEKQWDLLLEKLVVIMAGVLIVAVCGGFAEFVLKTDYGLAGVLAIIAMYLFRKSKEVGFSAGIFILAVFSNSTEIVALLMLLPLMKYDGTRGKSLKYVFYVFYPVHLLILALICMFLGV